MRNHNSLFLYSDTFLLMLLLVNSFTFLLGFSFNLEEFLLLIDTLFWKHDLSWSRYQSDHNKQFRNVTIFIVPMEMLIFCIHTFILYCYMSSVQYAVYSIT